MSAPFLMPGSFRFSIILVQGLGAHPYYTWIGHSGEVPREQRSMLSKLTSTFFGGVNAPGEWATADVLHIIPGRGEVFWPRDLLPSHLPPSRIATYSYRSDWLSGKFTATLRELAEQFLGVLDQHRCDTQVGADEDWSTVTDVIRNDISSWSAIVSEDY